ncbi:MAG: transposase, partial [Nitrosomonas ureae]
MDLIHNSSFRILDGKDTGIYRVVLDEIQIGKTAVVRLDPPEESRKAKGGRKKLAQTKNKRKKAPPLMLGETLWLDRNELQALKEGVDITL